MDTSTEVTNGTTGFSWQEFCDNAPEEAPQREDLPPNAWVLVETATESNGNAAPKVEVFEGKADPTKTYTKLKMGLLAVGGDSNIKREVHNRGMLFVDVFVHPGAKEAERSKGKAWIAGRLTGFLNTLFASGVAEDEKDSVARSRARWQATAGVLQRAAEDEGLHVEQYDGDKAKFTAAVAAKALQKETRRLLVRTELGDEYKGKRRTEVASFEDATPANMAKRKVEEFAEEATF